MTGYSHDCNFSELVLPISGEKVQAVNVETLRIQGGFKLCNDQSNKSSSFLKRSERKMSKNCP